MDLLEKDVVPFLSDTGYWLSSVFFALFCVSWCSKCFSWWKVWTTDRPVRHLDSPTMKLCCCNSCSVWFSIVLSKTQCLPWKRCHLDGIMCCSKTCLFRSALMMSSHIWRLPVPWILTHSCIIRDSGLWIKCWQQATWSFFSRACPWLSPWLSPFRISFGLKKAAMFLDHIYIWLPLCMIEL